MSHIREIDHPILRVVNIDSMLLLLGTRMCGGATSRRNRRGSVARWSIIIDPMPIDGELGRAGGAALGKEARNLDRFRLRLEPFEEPTICLSMKARGIKVGPVAARHGAEGQGLSIYVTDPEGHVVELKSPPSG